LLLLLLLVHAAFAGEPPISAEARAEMISVFEKSRTEADDALAREPSSVDWLTRRGDARAFPRRCEGAVRGLRRRRSRSTRRTTPRTGGLGIAY